MIVINPVAPLAIYSEKARLTFSRCIVFSLSLSQYNNLNYKNLNYKIVIFTVDCILYLLKFAFIISFDKFFVSVINFHNFKNAHI